MGRLSTQQLLGTPFTDYVLEVSCCKNYYRIVQQWDPIWNGFTWSRERISRISGIGGIGCKQPLNGLANLTPSSLNLTIVICSSSKNKPQESRSRWMTIVWEIFALEQLNSLPEWFGSCPDTTPSHNLFSTTSNRKQTVPSNLTALIAPPDSDHSRSQTTLNTQLRLLNHTTQSYSNPTKVLRYRDHPSTDSPSTQPFWPRPRDHHHPIQGRCWCCSSPSNRPNQLHSNAMESRSTHQRQWKEATSTLPTPCWSSWIIPRRETKFRQWKRLRLSHKP